MAVEQVVTEVVMRAQDQMSPAMRQAATNVELLEKRSQAAKAALGAMAGIASTLVVGALSDAARAAADEQKGIAQLEQSLANVGVSYQQVGDAIEAKIAAQQRSLAFGDGPQRDSLQRLVTITGDVGQAFRLQALAMDLARAKNLDLVTASEIVGKVAAGNTSALSRYGIVLDKGASSTEALAELQRRFSGQAEAYGRTTQGAIERVQLALGDFQETIGAALGPAQQYIALLPGLSAGFSAAGAAGGLLATALRGTPALLGSVAAALNPITLATKAWTLAQTALNLVMGANPIAIVVLALAGLAAALKFAYDHSEAFRQVVQAVFDWLGRLLSPLRFVAEALGTLARMSGLVSDQTDQMTRDVTRDWSDFARVAGDTAEQTQQKVVGSATKMETEVAAAFRRMRDAGVGEATDLQIDATLRALGMKDDVINAVGEMVTGVKGKSEAQRDALIRDMQMAQLETALKARGMKDAVIAEIKLMVENSALQTEQMQGNLRRRALLMQDDLMSVGSQARGAARGIETLADEIAAMRDKTVHVTVVTERIDRVITERIDAASRGNIRAAAHGFDGLVTQPTTFVAGEGGRVERVTVRPLGGVGSPLADRASGDVHLHFHGNVYAGERGLRELAREIGAIFTRRADLVGGAVS